MTTKRATAAEKAYAEAFGEPRPELLPTHPDYAGELPPPLEVDDTVPDWAPEPPAHLQRVIDGHTDE